MGGSGERREGGREGGRDLGKERDARCIQRRCCSPGRRKTAESNSSRALHALLTATTGRLPAPLLPPSLLASEQSSVRSLVSCVSVPSLDVDAAGSRDGHSACRNVQAVDVQRHGEEALVKSSLIGRKVCHATHKKARNKSHMLSPIRRVLHQAQRRGNEMSGSPVMQAGGLGDLQRKRDPEQRFRVAAVTGTDATMDPA